MTELAPIEQIPLVIDDELPFVVHAYPDPRPHLGGEGLRLRRGPDRIIVEMGVENAWVNMVLLDLEDGTYFIASLGPLLDPFWDGYARSGASLFTASEMVRCPLLITALMHHLVPVAGDDVSVDVSVLPPSADVAQTLALVGTEAHAAQELTEAMVVYAMPAAKVAMGILEELASLDRAPQTSPRPHVGVPRFDGHLTAGASALAGRMSR